MNQAVALIVFFDLLLINGQIIPDIAPPEVGRNYDDTKCTDATLGRIFCDQAIASVTCSTERGICVANGRATTIEVCQNFCDDVATSAAVFAGRAQCTRTRPFNIATRFAAQDGTPPTNIQCTLATAPASIPFACLQFGIFPDVNNCSNYYRCDTSWLNDGSTQLLATQINCPANSVFDPTLTGPIPCVSNRIDDTCIVATCSPDSAEVMQYTRMNSNLGEFGIRCVGRARLVYRCGPNSQIRFVTSDAPPSCFSVCRFENQQFANPNNPRRFSVCRRNAQGALVSVSVDCSPSQFYDPARNICVS